MKVSVSILCSHSNHIGSKLIRLFTSFLEPQVAKIKVPSHVAILVNDRWVHESTLETGVHVISYDKWSLINKEVNRIPIEEREYSAIKDIFRDMKNKDYDKLGIVYFGWRIFLKLLFNIAIPIVNRLQSKNKFFCSELVGRLVNQNYSMKAPVQIMADNINP
jgi:hypothetical protein